METFAKAILEYPPAWAGGWGEDRLGTFAELAYGGAVFRFRWIPPGMFWMGSPDEEKGRYADEGPRHRVRISWGFWLAETPCTQEQWQAVMGENPSHFSQGESGKRPVENVSWMMANEFCWKLTGAAREQGALEGRDVFRLPTEAEWEYACRAGTESAFNDGSDCSVADGRDPALTRLGWHGEGGKGETHPVKGKLPNAWGLYDIHGNIWEWCQDGRRTYQAEAEIIPNPIGPTDSGARRVLRGGSYWFGARGCRSAYRYEDGPGLRNRDIGFRFAAGQPPEAGSGASGASQGRSEG